MYCRLFGINYIWLLESSRKSYLRISKNNLDDLAETYNLSENAKELVKKFVSMPEEKRDIIMELFDPIKKDGD